MQDLQDFVQRLGARIIQVGPYYLSAHCKEPEHVNGRKEAGQIILLGGRLSTDTYLAEVILNGLVLAALKFFLHKQIEPLCK